MRNELGPDAFGLVLVILAVLCRSVAHNRGGFIICSLGSSHCSVVVPAHAAKMLESRLLKRSLSEMESLTWKFRWYLNGPKLLDGPRAQEDIFGLLALLAQKGTLPPWVTTVHRIGSLVPVRYSIETRQCSREGQAQTVSLFLIFLLAWRCCGDFNYSPSDLPL